MPKGKIKYYNSEKSFGFITQDSGEDDVFLHTSALKGWDPDDLRVGQRVKYEVVKGKKGLVAQDAEILLTPIEKRWLSQGKAIIPRDYSGRLFQSQDSQSNADGISSVRHPPTSPRRSSTPQQPKTESSPHASSPEITIPQAVESHPHQREKVEQKKSPPKAKSEPLDRPTFGDLYIQKQIRLQTPMFFGLYNHVQLSATVSEFTKYSFMLQSDEEDQELSKTDVKYCYKAEDAERIQSLIRYDEKIKAQKLEAVVSRKERYTIDTQEIADARKDRYPIEVTTREGEIFRGLVDWVSKYEIKMILENRSKIIVFRHSICDFEAFPTDDRDADENELSN